MKPRIRFIFLEIVIVGLLGYVIYQGSITIFEGIFFLIVCNLFIAGVFWLASWLYKAD